MYLVTFVRIEQVAQRQVYGYATVDNVEDWIISTNTEGMMHFILNVIEVSDNFRQKVIAADELKKVQKTKHIIAQ